MIENIEVGQILCCNICEWVDQKTGYDIPGPTLDEMVTIRKIGVEYDGCQFVPIVWLEEYPGDTDDDAFVLSDENFSLTF
jgi:hypothetical protein